MKKVLFTVNTKTDLGTYQNVDFGLSCELDLSKDKDKVIKEFYDLFFESRAKFVKAHYETVEQEDKASEVEIVTIPKTMLYD